MLLLITLAACGEDGSDESGTAPGADLGPERPELSRRVVVTRDNLDLPRSCRPDRVASLALRFSDALNRGDERALSEAWSGPFNWFSVTAVRAVHSAGDLVQPHGRRRHFVAHSSDAALDYARDPRGFRIRLTEFVVNGLPITGGVNVYYGGVWREPVGNGMRRYGLDGKGFVNCSRRLDGPTIRVWSMAVEGDPALDYGTCRGGDARPRDLVVCWWPE
jgi:hypothetical protein